MFDIGKMDMPKDIGGPCFGANFDMPELPKDFDLPQESHFSGKPMDFDITQIPGDANNTEKMGAFDLDDVGVEGFDVQEGMNTEDFDSGELNRENMPQKKDENTEALGNNEAKGCPIEGNGGHWEGERGNSKWVPNKDMVPTGQHTNPEGQSWGEILSEYGTDGIDFTDGEPDFSEFSKATVEIDKMTDKRLGKGGNFDQADQALMKQTGMTKDELKEFKEGHTWHEKIDGKTMELVDTRVHGNVSHEGGVAQYNKEV